MSPVPWNASSVFKFTVGAAVNQLDGVVVFECIERQGDGVEATMLRSTPTFRSICAS